ncbi:hypothetical protein [Amaricoccus macauensis]|uniref:hypothetical protein n=1 Tax=Amaricoccus macauensis TaxID=57001 RepID=UPI003C7B010D
MRRRRNFRQHLGNVPDDIPEHPRVLPVDFPISLATIDEAVHRSESETGHRNPAIVAHAALPFRGHPFPALPPVKGEFTPDNGRNSRKATGRANLTNRRIQADDAADQPSRTGRGNPT